MLTYTEQELQQLHGALYEILSEIDRVCREHGIRYFVIGGTAIGVHFWDDFIPWDDDIDIGMMRSDYERFLKIAPESLSEKFFMQHLTTEPHTPYFFAKVRKNGTLFCEEQFHDLNIHQGIFVDVFPFDNAPSSRFADKLQYKLMHYFTEVFSSKEQWQYARFGRSKSVRVLRRGIMATLLARLLVTCLSKRALYKIICMIQQMQRDGTGVVKNAICENERIPVEDILNAEERMFGPLKTFAPRNLQAYLTNHYGHVEKDIPEEKRISHRPMKLKF